MINQQRGIMYCRHCGKNITDHSKFCTHCGKLAMLSDSQSETNDFGEEKKTKEPYQKWSWGAFGLGWIYFAGMKYRYYGWLIVLTIIVNGLMKNENLGAGVIGLVLWVVMIIIFGIKGRAIAWESRNWQDKKDFINVQKRWDIWGIVIFVILQSIVFLLPVE